MRMKAIALAAVVTITAAFNATAADCPVDADVAAKIMPMPDLKMKEPMPTGMAKDGTMKEDVTHAAAGKAPCMDMMLKQEQQSIDKKPTN